MSFPQRLQARDSSGDEVEADCRLDFLLQSSETVGGAPTERRTVGGQVRRPSRSQGVRQVCERQQELGLDSVVEALAEVLVFQDHVAGWPEGHEARGDPHRIERGEGLHQGPDAALVEREVAREGRDRTWGARDGIQETRRERGPRGEPWDRREELVEFERMLPCRICRLEYRDSLGRLLGRVPVPGDVDVGLRNAAVAGAPAPERE
ncbi:hypothetical protein ACFPRL_07245 [Pseudoclavibacter helvolus]